MSKLTFDRPDGRFRPVVVALAMTVALLVAAAPASADTVRLTVDKAQVLRLDRDAAIVHIANPSIADVNVESPRVMFLVGLQPGETSLIVLDREGNEMMTSSLVVVPNEAREIVVNRNANEFVFSCSPRCTQVDSPGQEGGGGGAGGVTSSVLDNGGSGAPSDGGDDLAEDEDG